PLPSPESAGLIVGASLLEHLSTDIGKRGVIMTQSTTGQVVDRGFRIVGTFETELEVTEKSFVFTGRKTAQEFLEIGDAVSEVSLVVRDPKSLNTIASEVSRLAEGSEVLTWRKLDPIVGAMAEIQNGFLIL